MINFIQIQTEKQAVKIIRKHLGGIHCPKSGAVNREFNYINLEIIPDQDQGTLEKFIFDNIDHRCSLITTDSHPSYNQIEWMCYGHRWENHSKF